MKHSMNIAWSLALLLLLVAGPSQAQDRATMLRTSDIVFDGTVLHLGTASFYGVPVSENTMMVRIDKMHYQPASVMLVVGDTVTVKALDASVFSRDAQATFYTQGWIFGEGVAVSEVGHEVQEQNAGITQAQDNVSQIRQQQQDEQLRARMEAAEMVIVGRVVSVGASTIASFQSESQPISEHTANWQEAVIEVDEWIKGPDSLQQVVMRFPTSMDVQWYDAPRFVEGQEGVFICMKDQVSGVQLAMHSGQEVTAYTALGAQDVHPTDQADRLKALMADQ